LVAISPDSHSRTGINPGVLDSFFIGFVRLCCDFTFLRLPGHSFHAFGINLHGLQGLFSKFSGHSLKNAGLHHRSLRAILRGLWHGWPHRSGSSATSAGIVSHFRQGTVHIWLKKVLVDWLVKVVTAVSLSGLYIKIV
jgi:hypothetical protein